jgi:hypothetical protein
MTNFKQKLFILLCLFVLTSIPVALCSASTIYVSGAGNGNYNCDGKDDQVQINQALDYAAKHPGTTVYLKGPFVYDIRSVCLIGSNTELTGDSSAKLRLHNSNGWTSPSASHYIIGQIGGSGSAVHDINIHGFEIDGNEGAQAGAGGKDLYRLISIRGSSNAPVSNIRVYNMNLHDAKGEGFRCTFGKNIYYYNNVGANLQHTCVMYAHVNTGEIRDNVAHQCSCSGDRLDNCQNIAIYNEKISPYSGATKYPKDSKGYAMSDLGIYVCNADPSPATSNINIHNCNIMSGVNGILFDCLKDNCNVNFYNNVIHDSGYESEAVSRNGGICFTNCGNGITIRNNDITGYYVAGINVNSAIKGVHTVTVANNNIINGKSGYAIKNSVPSYVKLILTHNYLHGNKADLYPSSLSSTNIASSPNSKLSAGSTVTTLDQTVFSTLNIRDYLSNIVTFINPFIDTNQNTIDGKYNSEYSVSDHPVAVYSSEENTF